MPDTRAIAIIPARGGSKRLPRKNILPFNGRPIIEYTIEAALESGCFDRVIVSSDDDEILKIAEDAGAEASRRSDDLGSDTAEIEDVCIEFLDRESVKGLTYETLAVLYATAALRNANDIRETMSLLDDESCDCALAATDFSHYVHQALVLKDEGYVEPRWPELYLKAPAEIGPLVAGNGSTYCAKIAPFMASRQLVGERTRAYLMPMNRSIDIDTMEDFHLAESIHRLQNSLG